MKMAKKKMEEFNRVCRRQPDGLLEYLEVRERVMSQNPLFASQVNPPRTELSEIICFIEDKK
jgi:hypothetical protein